MGTRFRKPTYLREWRQNSRLTQDQAAQQLGIEQGTLSKIERGKIPYNQDFLESAAVIYKCDASDLFAVNPRQNDTLSHTFSLLRSAPRDKREMRNYVADATAGGLGSRPNAVPSYPHSPLVRVRAPG